MSDEIEIVHKASEIQPKLGGLRFTQSKTHTHTPWFSWDLKGELRGGQMFYGFSGKYAHIIDRAKHEFASALGLGNIDYIMVSTKPDPSDPISPHYFRLSAPTPQGYASRAGTKKLEVCEYIDVEATPERPRIQ